MSSSPPVLCLVDGFGFVFRAYHAIRPLTNAKGMSTHALFGYTNMLLKSRKVLKPDYLAVALESPGPTFRQQIYPEYKANRPEVPADLKEQIPWVEPITEALGIPALRMPGLEADDVIAGYVERAVDKGFHVVVVSADKDLMQLVRDPTVRLFDPMKDKWYNEAEVLERYGVMPKNVVDLLSLMGDSSDNVPGVSGIGAKGAAALVQQFGDVESILAHAQEVKQNRTREALLSGHEDARLSKRLITLETRFDLPRPLEELVLAPRDPERLRTLFQELGFHSFLRDLLPASQPSVPQLSSSNLAGVAAASPSRIKPLPLFASAASRASSAPDDHVPGDSLSGTETYVETVPAVLGDVSYVGAMPAPAIVRTEQAIRELADRIRVAGKVALDTETTSLQATRAELVGLSLALSPDSLFYVPIAHRGPAAGAQLPLELVRAILGPVLSDPAVGKVGQHFKYDSVVLRCNGFQPAGLVFDTMLASYILDPGRTSHGLDGLAAEFLGVKTISYKEVTRQGGLAVRFDDVPVPEAARYSAEDVWATWLLMDCLEPRLVEQGLMSLLTDVELPVSEILAEMERVGVAIDPQRLGQLSKEFAGELLDVERQVYEAAGAPFNINSPKQLGEVLFERLGLPKGKKTKTGYSTDVTVLEELAPLHPVAASVLRYRTLTKLKGTYVDVLPELVNPRTGRIHTSYNQAVAATGRLSSSDPNLQNIPVRGDEGRRIREAFVPASGTVLLSADYSQIELRVLAHLAGDAHLVEAFKRGDDIHARTAAELFHVLPAMVTPDQRRLAKTINFGILYGMSAFRLAREQGLPYKQAEKFIKDYFARYPGIDAFMKGCIHQANELGYVETLLRRRRYIPDARSSNAQVRSAAERIAVNTPVQGGAADIIKLAMIRLDSKLRQSGTGARVIMQVHDELVLEVPLDQIEPVRELVIDAMESVMDLAVPLKVGACVGHNWAQAHG